MYSRVFPNFFGLLIQVQIPIYLQVAKEVSRSKSGILVRQSIVCLIIHVLFSGSAVSIVGYYVPFMIVSSILTAIAAGLLTNLEASAVPERLICYQAFFFGSGCGIGYQGTQIAVQKMRLLASHRSSSRILSVSQSLCLWHRRSSSHRF